MAMEPQIIQTLQSWNKLRWHFTQFWIFYLRIMAKTSECFNFELSKLVKAPRKVWMRKLFPVICFNHKFEITTGSRIFFIWCFCNEWKSWINFRGFPWIICVSIRYGLLNVFHFTDTTNVCVISSSLQLFRSWQISNNSSVYLVALGGKFWLQKEIKKKLKKDLSLMRIDDGPKGAKTISWWRWRRNKNLS